MKSIVFVFLLKSFFAYSDTLYVDLKDENWLINDSDFGLLFPRHIKQNFSNGFYKFESERFILYGNLHENNPISKWSNYDKISGMKISEIYYTSQNNYIGNFIAYKFDSTGRLQKYYELNDYVEIEKTIENNVTYKQTKIFDLKQIVLLEHSFYKNDNIIYYESENFIVGSHYLKSYNEKGFLIQEKYWQNNLKSRVWKYYDKNGINLCEEYYQNDSLIKIIFENNPKYSYTIRKKTVKINVKFSKINLHLKGEVKNYFKYGEWIFLDLESNHEIGKTVHDNKGNLVESRGLFESFIEW